MAKKSKKKLLPLRKTFKTLYLLLFLLCAVIVVVYCAGRLIFRPPAVGDETVVEIPITPSDSLSAAPMGGSEQDGREDAPPQVTTITLERKEDFHTFLLMGTDDGNGNADTLMVGAYDVKNNKISVLSVPRDTLVDVEREIKKINGAYGEGGVAQVINELTPILGFRPDHYIKVDIQAFVDVVNILGGVSFYVPEDMYHNDGAGFIIDLKEGTQWLNGEQALQLVRYRGYEDKSADLGRMRTQQKFLQQTAKQVLSWSTVPKINEFARVFVDYLDTDLSVTELAYFATCALTLDFSADVAFATLPGHGDASYRGVNWYYELYPEQVLDLVNQTVNPYTTDIPAELTDVFQVP